MPDTLPSPEPVAPSFPVKRLPFRHDKNVVVSPSPPTRPGSIVESPDSISGKQLNGQNITHSGPRASTFDEHGPLLLSERESIFATHYTPVENDPTTPRLPPVAGALTQPSSADSLGSDMELSLPPLSPGTPSKISLKSSFTAAGAGSGAVAGGRRQYGQTVSEKSVDKQIPSRNGQIYGIRRVASDGYPLSKSVRVGGERPDPSPRSDQPQALLHENAMEDSNKTKTEANAVEPSETQQQDPGQGAQHPSAMSQAMRPTRSERSVSRGRTHVDKSIEATLANTEPGQNIRSRKSSHLMGVFRENQSSLDSRPRDTYVKHGEEDTWAVQSVSRPNLPSRQTSSRRTSATTNAELELRENALPEQDQLFMSTLDQRLQTEPFSIQKSAPPDLPQTQSVPPRSASEHDHDPYFRKQDAVKQTKNSQNPLIPASLLEQIREHHNLVPIRGQGSHLPKDRIGFTSNRDTGYTDRRQLRTGNDERQTDDNEEHISSAVYFPHSTPSLEDVERFSLPEGDQLTDGVHHHYGGTAHAGGQTHKDVKRHPLDLSLPEHIDISVQSKHEKRVFHGDYQPTEQAVDEESDRDVLPTITERLAENYTIISDSDLESGEDVGLSSQTDDGEITPTATPALAGQSPHKRRASISANPKGAVVLEPYSHQVGGHSTIFRFSRRAVCKQLNNRENEFYERIERRHPDMLHFLPRYIGVLNVTFSKGPKPSKDTSTGAQKVGEELKKSKRDSEDQVMEDPTLEDPKKQKHIPPTADNEQRIVSQSQQIGERPQVILEQNRHIVPFSLFDSGGRELTREPERNGDCLRPSSGPEDPEHGSSRDSIPPFKNPALARPILPSPPSWGKTSVNSKFGEQVWREFFSLPQIHHYKRHSKGHSTLPRLREPGIRRKSNLSADTLNQDQRAASIPADEGRIPAQANKAGAGQAAKMHDNAVDIPGKRTPRDSFSASASALEDLSYALEKVRTTNSISSEGSQVSLGGQRIKRRHSGMGLRRRGKSVHDQSRGNLEYYEEEGYGGDSEQEALEGEDDGGIPKTTSAAASATVPQGIDNVASPVLAPNEGQKSEAHNGIDDVSQTPPANITTDHAVPEGGSTPNHLPLNPKEAQLAKPDQRVVFFLLLEDLTADMGRPCVLDLKMGTRQYGIEATPKKMESQRRKCKTTTSQQLGVRICGMQTFNVKKQQPAYEDKYFGRDLKTGREFREALTRFLYDGVSYSSVAKRIPTILDKLSKLENMVRRLPGYRFYASSLLMLYDAEPEKSQMAKEKASRGEKNGEKTDEKKKDKDPEWPPPIDLKIVDFANCVTGEDPLPPTASCPPFHPGTVDRGYLRGLRTLRLYFQHILRDITESDVVDRGDGEATGIEMMGDMGIHGGSETVTEEDDFGEVSI